MRKKIYQQAILDRARFAFENENSIQYFTLSLIARGRKSVVLCEPASYYNDLFGKTINAQILSLLDDIGVSYTLHERKDYSIFNSPTITITSQIFNDFGRVVICR